MQAGSLWHRGPVDNLSLDLLDSHAYDCLLHQLAPDCGINLQCVCLPSSLSIRDPLTGSIVMGPSPHRALLVLEAVFGCFLSRMP